MNKQQLFETMIEVEQLTGSTEVQDQILSSVRMTGLGLLIPAIFLVGCGLYLLYKERNDTWHNQDGFRVFIASLLFFFALVGAITGTQIIAKTYYAPKVVILEHFTE